MKKKYGFFLYGFIILFVFTVVLPGNADAAERAEGVQLRILHAAPELPALDVYIDGQKAVTGLAYKEFTGYILEEDGGLNVEFYPAGIKADKNTPVLTAAPENKAGDIVTFAVNGLNDSLSLNKYKDDQINDNENAKLRIIHLSADTPIMNVYSLETPLFKNISFQDSSSYETIPPGSYSLDFKVEGHDMSFYRVPDVELSKGVNTTLYLTGLLKGEPPFSIIPSVDKE